MIRIQSINILGPHRSLDLLRTRPTIMDEVGGEEGFAVVHPIVILHN
jgi:hypothetical protein